MQSLLAKLYEAKWALVGIAIVIFIVWISLPYITPIVFALFMYYITRPVKRWLHQYIKNEALVALGCLLLLTLPLVAIILYLILFAIGQLNTFLAQSNIPMLPPGQLTNVSLSISAVQQSFSQGDFKYESLGTTIQEWYDRLSIYWSHIFSLKDLLYSTGMTIVDATFKIILMLLLAFFLLLHDDRMARWFRKTFPGLVTENNELFVRYFKAVDDDFEKVFFGNVLSIVFFAIIATAVYSILNFFAPDPAFVIPFPVLLGIFSGIAALLPILGGWMVDVPILLYALAQSLINGSFSKYWWYLVVMAITIFVLVENLPNYLLRPFVSHGKVDVGLLMLAYILGPVIFGFPGLFLGAMLLVIITHYFRIVVPEISGGKKEYDRRAGGEQDRATRKRRRRR
ncbi:AI-2E family transporter [Methanocella sp. MCL-LM]|uniref:AI-2E family transporter n=1 Tax=Methanocella sp. MCL-LM TaxID=3412035 RepID=UPI003C71F6DC